jgi:hypothetical protein
MTQQSSHTPTPTAGQLAETLANRARKADQDRRREVGLRQERAAQAAGRDRRRI